MLGFSSTLSTQAFNGGLRYNATTTAAFGRKLLVGADAPTAPPLPVDALATENTSDNGNAGLQLFRYRWPIPVGHTARRRLLQQFEHPVAKRRVILDGLAGSQPIV